MGYNIGMRLVEDFLAKANSPACANFRETAETISKVRYYQIATLVDTSLTAGPVDRIQDLPERHAYGHQLDKRQQTVLFDLRRQPSRGLCGAA